MTETLVIPKDIGRNDPCPCGSGKKYKKCHFREQQMQAEAARQTRSVETLILPETIPWEVFKLLGEASQTNLFGFFHDMTHELGPLRQRFPERTAFLIAADGGEFTLPAGAGYELVRLRVDAPDVVLLLVKGAQDQRVSEITYELVTLRPNQSDDAGEDREVAHAGWRVWDVQRMSRAKSEVSAPDGDLDLDTLGLAWHPRTFVRPTPQPEAADAPQAEQEVASDDADAT